MFFLPFVWHSSISSYPTSHSLAPLLLALACSQSPNMLATKKKIDFDQDLSEKPNWLVLGFFILIFIYAFLLSLEIMSRGFGLLAGTYLRQFFGSISNPFASLCIGILVTAVIQSSSAVTSILVALVAAGTLSLQEAIPFVLGSNIGTTFTASLVSLTHISTKKEFRKGFATGLIHNIFNVFGCLLFFPLEYYFGFLSKASMWCTKASATFFGSVTGSPGYFVSTFVSPIAKSLVDEGNSVVFWCIIALFMLFSCILLFRTFLKIIIIGDLERNIDQRLFGSPFGSLLFGAGITAFIHSSTVTTSLCVPLAATNKVSIRKLFPFIIGANVGTTITALMAALSRNEAAIALAFSHLLFNTFTAIIVFPTPPLKIVFVKMARAIAQAFSSNRLLAVLYLVGFFFLLPLLAIYLLS